VRKGGIRVNAKEIGQKLVVLRGKRTQEEIAKQLDISISALSMYERGERIPRDNIKIRISNFYEKPISEIFFNQEQHET
jgi:transcriptional regulator with XRE-family HTH domain